MHTASETTHVVKLGGSLLDLPDLVERFETYRAAELLRRSLLIVGGGQAADTVRAFDARFGLGEEKSHWLAVRAMAFNAHLVAAALPGAELVDGAAACAAVWQRGGLAVLDPLPWLEREAAAGEGGEHAWTFTSDSIAAQVAVQLGADRLTLLKSTLPTSARTATDAARMGVVDTAFARASAGLGYVELIDLRSPGWPRCRLRDGEATDEDK